LCPAHTDAYGHVPVTDRAVIFRSAPRPYYCRPPDLGPRPLIRVVALRPQPEPALGSNHVEPARIVCLRYPGFWPRESRRPTRHVGSACAGRRGAAPYRAFADTRAVRAVEPVRVEVASVSRYPIRGGIPCRCGLRWRRRVVSFAACGSSPRKDRATAIPPTPAENGQFFAR